MLFFDDVELGIPGRRREMLFFCPPSSPDLAGLLALTPVLEPNDAVFV